MLLFVVTSGALLSPVAAGAATPAPTSSTRPSAAPKPSTTSSPTPKQTAATGCTGGGPSPGVQASAVPWAQARYQPQRLTGVADGSGVTVAVVDSGVDNRNPQLRGRVLAGDDLLDPAGDGRLDCVPHGTGVASIIAAGPQKGVPFVGLAPGARILPVRATEQEVVGNGRSTTASGFAKGIRYAVDHGASVINLSLVLYSDQPEVRDAIGYAQAHDVVVVAAVGNMHGQGNGPDPTPYPAAYPGVVGVGAIDQTGARLSQSQTGSYVDIAAPGAGIIADAAGSGQGSWDGTSFATPFASATAALIRSRYPRLTADQVVARILATADPAPGAHPRNDEYGYGILNPYRAVTDTVGTAAPRHRVAPLPARTTDPNQVAAAGAHRRTRALALQLAACGLGLAALVGLFATVLPRGSRRGWRPGRA